ncbi:hypothetical protein A3F34_03140 [Candidatus Roizmanbacteria bacterium RIFCSPHIGHO2_12_FULL_44_10]|uniref:Uncharacterized protein n=1 Tax=Candidatus Roizmanbacteria bacterium RIFCSPHIGHO2_12_FULL_44_10 TaxID=1802054 RepID=A0A1F7IAQ5_9BACT|nr:MAG: hypothetical protein A3F34_03140 [Candidatus Roizmanbacteria bacterium RIFCSPHIGHO2_12_FULL_44_10]
MLNEYFIFLGIAINGIGTIYYVRDTLKGKVKPNKVTFLMWSIAALVTFSAQVAQGVGMQTLVTLSFCLFPISIFLASFFNRKAYWKISIFDSICGLLSLVGLILWQLTGIGNVAILFSIFAEGWATLPTIIKSYTHPETELAWTYLASVVGSVLALLTIKNYTFANSAFVLFYTLEMFLVFVLAQFKLGKKFPG